MTFQETKQMLQECFKAADFIRKKSVYLRDFGSVAVLLTIRIDYGTLVNIDIGFWLKSINAEVPSKVEQCHIYMRLECLINEVLELYWEAIDLENPKQEAALKKLRAYFEENFGPALRDLASDENLAVGLSVGKFENALVRKEARAHLLEIKQH